MRVTEIEGLRDLWYAVALADGTSWVSPRRVQLFGCDYTLWQPEGGRPVLTEAQCPHRGASLVSACVEGRRLVCCYHGWEFDSSGACRRVPQLEPGLPVPPKARLRTWPVVERYGLFWTCVGEPTAEGPPPFAEADDLNWRVQVDFFEPWAASALRIVDNNIDQSHPAFVHRGTFGDPSRALVPPYELERTATGLRARVPQDVGGVGPQMGDSDEGTRYKRIQEVELLDAMHTRIRLSYGGTAPDYAFYGSATPVDDVSSTYVRVSALAGGETDQPYAMFWEFSRRVTFEDKVVLEQTSPDFPVDVTSEVHLRCDKTTLEYRRQLARLVAPATPVPGVGVASAGGSSGSNVESGAQASSAEPAA